MPEFHAPREELAAYLETNTPWVEVAEEYGYRTGRQARHAAMQARDELEAEGDDEAADGTDV